MCRWDIPRSKAERGVLWEKIATHGEAGLKESPGDMHRRGLVRTVDVPRH